MQLSATSVQSILFSSHSINQYTYTPNQSLITSNKTMMKSTFFALIAALFVTTINGFVTPTVGITKNTRQFPTAPQSIHTKTSSLSMGRQWNFNEGRGPFGLKKNAEIWNGRAAQMCFVIVLLQELITGKGVIQGIQEGDPFNVIMLGITVASLGGLTVFLGLKGKEKYIDLD
jgi:hypothetical protein